MGIQVALLESVKIQVLHGFQRGIGIASTVAPSMMDLMEMSTKLSKITPEAFVGGLHASVQGYDVRDSNEVGVPAATPGNNLPINERGIIG